MEFSLVKNLQNIRMTLGPISDRRKGLPMGDFHSCGPAACSFITCPRTDMAFAQQTSCSGYWHVPGADTAGPTPAKKMVYERGSPVQRGPDYIRTCASTATIIKLQPLFSELFSKHQKSLRARYHRQRHASVRHFRAWTDPTPFRPLKAVVSVLVAIPERDRPCLRFRQRKWKRLLW